MLNMLLICNIMYTSNNWIQAYPGFKVHFQVVQAFESHVDILNEQVNPFCCTGRCIALKRKRNERCTNNIDQLRNELHQLIEIEQISSGIVQERSRELDALILVYYKQKKECKALKEP